MIISVWLKQYCFVVDLAFCLTILYTALAKHLKEGARNVYTIKNTQNLLMYSYIGDKIICS